MKRKLQLFALVAVLFSLSTQAQKIEITPFYGYMLNGSINTYYYGKYNVSDGDNFGGLFSVELYKNGFVEFMYNRNDVEFVYSYQGTPQKRIGLGQEYYQLGTLKQVDLSETVKGFGTVTVGATRFIPKDSNDWDNDGSVTSLNDKWTFSATLGAGLKIFLSDRIGLRMQARLLLPMQFNGLFIGIGSGGASGGASFHVPMVSGDFTGGLIIRLGE